MPPGSLILGLRRCFLSSHHGRSNLLSNSECWTSARNHVHTTSLQSWWIPSNLCFDFFLSTACLKHPVPQIITQPPDTVPLQDVALLHTLLLAIIKPAGEAVEGSWAPAAHIWAQGITNVPGSSWEKRKDKKSHEDQSRREGKHGAISASILTGPGSPTPSKAAVNGLGSMKEEQLCFS